MNTAYISTDVEYSGDNPHLKGQGSILSLGSCKVGDINTSFYRELQPINGVYNEAAMKAISHGFQYLGADVGNITGEQILNRLRQYGAPPEEVFHEYTHWLSTHQEPICEVASPIKFDGGLTAYYFRTFCEKNPFGFSGVDGNSLLKGFLGEKNMSFKRLLGEQELPHNALRDSQIQAIEYEFLFEMMQQNKTEAKVQIRYQQSPDTFLQSPDIKKLVDWTREMIENVRNTSWGERVDYTPLSS